VHNDNKELLFLNSVIIQHLKILLRDISYYLINPIDDCLTSTLSYALVIIFFCDYCTSYVTLVIVQLIDLPKGKRM